MIIEIRDAILNQLKNEFPDHKRYGEQVKRGLIRPCFFVELIPVGVVDINTDWQERSIIVDVQYMSKEDTKLKNLEMSEELLCIFEEVLLSNDQKIRTTNRRFEIIDGILHFLFDLDFSLLKKQNGSEYENMGEFIFSKEVD